MIRRLLDPAPADGGGTPAPTPTPAVDTTIRVDANVYARTLAELETLRQASAQAEAKRQADLDAANQQRLAEIAEKEGLAAALRAQADDFRAKYESERTEKLGLESSILAEKKSLALAQAVAAFPAKAVSPDAAEQVQLLLDARFQPVREDGKVVVRDKVTGRPAAEVIPELLKSPTYSHFFAAEQKGGAGAKGGDTPPPDPKPVQPRNLGEAAILMAKQARESGQPLPGFLGGPSFFGN